LVQFPPHPVITSWLQLLATLTIYADNEWNVIIVLPHKVKKLLIKFSPRSTHIFLRLHAGSDGDRNTDSDSSFYANSRTGPHQPQSQAATGRIPIPVATVSSPAPSDPSVGILDSQSAGGDVQVGGWLIILALVLAITAHTDPRPNAVRKLTASIGKVMKQNHNNKGVYLMDTTTVAILNTLSAL